MKQSVFYNVLVIGGGISGITIAKNLKTKYKIIEQNSFMGGLSTQYSDNGYDFDYGGHYFHFLNKSFVKDYIGKYSRFNGYVKNSKVFLMNRLIPFPIQFHLSYLPKRIREKILDEMLSNDGKSNYANLDNYLSKIFGDTLHKIFFKPFLTKYYGFNLMNMAYNMDKGSIPIPSKKDVIDGYGGKRFKGVGYNPEFYYPKDGLKNFIYYYSKSIDENVDFNSKVLKVDLKKKIVYTKDREYKYKILVNTIPLKNFIKLLDGNSFCMDYEKKLKNISTEVSNIVLEKRRKRFHWAYLPQEKTPFYRFGYYPKKKNTVCYLERTIGKENEYEPEPNIYKTLKDLGIIENKNEIIYISRKIIPVSYIIFDNEWDKIVPRILNILKRENIYSIGRYGKWDYTSMSEDIVNAIETAREIRNG
jgi:protoporphyrinogen oxidase